MEKETSQHYLPGVVERDLQELHAEAGVTVVPQERAIIREQLRLAEQTLRERTYRAEVLPLLPELWEHLYGPDPGFVALFSAVRAAPEAGLLAPRSAYFAWPHETAAAVRWVEREAEADRELYHCGHLVTRWRRRREDAAPFHALYADLDEPAPADFPLPPSLALETSPGHRHVYFRLTHALPSAAGAQLNRRLALALGADPSGWDLTQLLRVPGMVNHKRDDRSLVRLLAEQPLWYDPGSFSFPCRTEVRWSHTVAEADDDRGAAVD